MRPRLPVVCATLTAAMFAAAAAGAADAGGAGAAPAGVANEQRAWQHWTLNCQGCHRPDGTGSPATAPALAGVVAKFLSVPGGRDYLGRVPGVAASPLADADLAEVLNWMLWRFDAADLPADFQPYTAADVARLRARPLRLDAAPLRAELVSRFSGGEVRSGRDAAHDPGRP
jgi:cytochrome c553